MNDKKFRRAAQHALPHKKISANKNLIGFIKLLFELDKATIGSKNNYNK